MKTTLKRTLAALLAALALLAGCGKDAPDAPGDARTDAGEKTTISGDNPASGDRPGGEPDPEADAGGGADAGGSAESAETEAPYRFAAERDAGEHMIYETIPDVRDGVTANLVSFAAIPRSSENKLNAWRLVMILLSDEIQGGHEDTIFKTDYLRIGFPVRRESMERRIAETVLGYYEGSPEYPEYDDEIVRDIADISEVYGRMTGCRAVQSTVSGYIWKNMKPFLMGKQSFDKCYDRLYSELELYAGE